MHELVRLRQTLAMLLRRLRRLLLPQLPRLLLRVLQLQRRCAGRAEVADRQRLLRQWQAAAKAQLRRRRPVGRRNLRSHLHGGMGMVGTSCISELPLIAYQRNERTENAAGKANAGTPVVRYRLCAVGVNQTRFPNVHKSSLAQHTAGG